MRRMARFLIPAASALLVAAMAPGRANAASAACGTIITNAATITFWSGPLDQIGYELSYNVTATVRVICPVTAVVKYAVPRVVAAGGTVTFFVCIDNQRMSPDGSVWNVTVTDKLPDGMGFVAFNPGAYIPAPGVVLSTSYATSLGGTWTGGSPAPGTQDPLYLRWVVSQVGTLKSACVTYSAQIL